MTKEIYPSHTQFHEILNVKKKGYLIINKKYYDMIALIQII